MLDHNVKVGEEVFVVTSHGMRIHKTRIKKQTAKKYLTTHDHTYNHDGTPSKAIRGSTAGEGELYLLTDEWAQHCWQLETDLQNELKKQRKRNASTRANKRGRFLKTACNHIVKLVNAGKSKDAYEYFARSAWRYENEL